MALVDIIGAALGGGTTGLLGTFGGRIFGYFERRQSHKMEVQRWGHNLKLEALKDARTEKNNTHELQLHELNRKVAHEEFEREIVARQQEGSFEGLKTSINDQTALTQNEKGSLWVLDTLRLVRPVLTLVLILLTGLVFFFGTDADQTEIIQSVVFVTVAAVLWWFGDRAPKPMEGGRLAVIQKGGREHEKANA